MIFAFNLIPPRPSFADDMADDEKAMMDRHVEYWQGLMADGVAVAFGPVVDPDGAYGLAVVEVEGQEHAERLISGDPAVRGGLTCKAYPMPGAFVRPTAPAR
ncbi:MAG TPA: YciI family protein [Actinoplanes sp.]|nr:YciI family protein [Actinoplanes sp.]